MLGTVLGAEPDGSTVGAADNGTDVGSRLGTAVGLDDSGVDVGIREGCVVGSDESGDRVGDPVVTATGTQCARRNMESVMDTVKYQAQCRLWA